MAIRVWAGSSFAGDAVTTSIDFDDVSLVMQAIHYQNTTSRDAAVEITGPSNFDRVFTLLANTPQTALDVSSANVRMASSVVTNPKTGQPMTVYNLPTGFGISTRWPA